MFQMENMLNLKNVNGAQRVQMLWTMFYFEMFNMENGANIFQLFIKYDMTYEHAFTNLELGT